MTLVSSTGPNVAENIAVFPQNEPPDFLVNFCALKVIVLPLFEAVPEMLAAM